MNSIFPAQHVANINDGCSAEIAKTVNDSNDHLSNGKERNSMIYVDLCTLTDRDFGKRRRTPFTCADLYQILDFCDAKDWYWGIVSDPAHSTKKEAWCERYMYPRNKLRFFDDYATIATGSTTLVARDLIRCRLFCALGGRAIWVDEGQLFDVSDNMRLLAHRAVADLQS